MNCIEWQEKLNAAHDGELGPADRASVDAHLAGCAECRRTSESLQVLGRELETLRVEMSPLGNRIIAAVHAEPRKRRGPWGFALLGAVAAAGIVVLLLRPPAPVPVPLKPFAQLVSATGPVQVRSSGRWTTLPPKGSLSVGDAVRTEGHSKCEIAFSDGSLLRLNAATEVEIQGPRLVHLKEGEMFARVTLQPSLFGCTTDQCRLNAMGGVLDLSHVERPEPTSKFDPPRPVSTVIALEGRTMMAVATSEQEVLPGSACQMAGGAHSPPESVDALLKTRWIHDLLKLKPPDDPELAARVSGMLAMLGRTKTPDSYEAEIRALGDRSVPALLTLVTNLPKELSVYDRRSAARLLSDLAGPSEVSTFVSLLRDPDSDVSASAMSALVRITGAALKGPEAWESWFRDQKKSVPEK
jgi:ferric-dicitrate binding protein FerR (iron transport regulator)